MISVAYLWWIPKWSREWWCKIKKQLTKCQGRWVFVGWPPCDWQTLTVCFRVSKKAHGLIITMMFLLSMIYFVHDLSVNSSHIGFTSNNGHRKLHDEELLDPNGKNRISPMNYMPCWSKHLMRNYLIPWIIHQLLKSYGWMQPQSPGKPGHCFPLISWDSKTEYYGI